MAICLEVGRALASRSPERALVGKVIKTRREELRVSQEAMAGRVGLSYAGYRPYERGERDLKSEDLPVWAEALQLTRAELATRLGFGSTTISSVYAAEIGQLIEAVDDPELVQDIMQTVRFMTRLANRGNRTETSS